MTAVQSLLLGPLNSKHMQHAQGFLKKLLVFIESLEGKQQSLYMLVCTPQKI
jgi:hypothetical protein